MALLATTRSFRALAGVDTGNRTGRQPVAIKATLDGPLPDMGWRWLSVAIGALVVAGVWWLYGSTAGTVALLIACGCLLYAVAYEAGYHQALAEHGLLPRHGQMDPNRPDRLNI